MLMIVHYRTDTGSGVLIRPSPIPSDEIGIGVCSTMPLLKDFCFGRARVKYASVAFRERSVQGYRVRFDDQIAG